MPRVVPDQREKFDNDELFRKLSRESEVRYTGHLDKTPSDRQLRLRSDCREGHASIAFANTGINLQLQFESNAWSSRREDRIPTSEFVDFDREPGKVHLKSQFIMNGVCVLWRGWLDLCRLDGTARLEYDHDRAAVEDAMLRQQIEQYNEAINRLHYPPQPRHHLLHHQLHHHQQLQQQQQQQSAGVSTTIEAAQTLLEISTSTTAASQQQQP